MFIVGLLVLAIVLLPLLLVICAFGCAAYTLVMLAKDFGSQPPVTSTADRRSTGPVRRSRLAQSLG